jgi:hypothetical protein
MPALACVAHQLRSVSLRYCLLHSGQHAEGAFAMDWDQLECLDLTSSSINTCLPVVNMPSLQQLYFQAFEVKDDKDGEALHASVQTFAAGSPKCSGLEFEPLRFPRLLHAPYKAFGALQRLCLMFRYTPEAEDMQGIDVPQTLTCLECMSTIRDSLPSWLHVTMELDLHVMLSTAAAFIEAGAPLQSLTLAECRTAAVVYEDSDDDGYDEDAEIIEPGQQEIVLLYRRLSASLRGLKRLDLSLSPHCIESAVNEVVSTAPDLTSLALHVSLPKGQAVHDRLVVCSQLQEVHVNLDILSRELFDGSCTFRFGLVDANRLCKCTLKLLDFDGNVQHGDAVKVVLECQESAGLDASVRMMPDGDGRTPDWELGIAVSQRAATSRQELFTATFVYAADKETWTSAVG